MDLCQQERTPQAVFAEGLRLNSQQLASLQESANRFVDKVLRKVLSTLGLLTRHASDHKLQVVVDDQLIAAWPMFRRDE